MRLTRPLLIVVCLTGCSFTALSGFSGGEDEQPKEALADTGADSGLITDDAATDTSTAAPDALADVAPDALGFCASLVPKPLHCLDFDDGLLQPLGWNKTTDGLPNPGTIELTTAIKKSSPYALRAAFGSGTSTRSSYISRYDNTGQVNHVRLGYSLYVEERPASNQFEINLLRFHKQSTVYDYYLEISKTGAEYWEQRITQQPTVVDSLPIPLSKPIPTSTWSRIVVDVNINDPPLVTITVDGVEAGRKTPTYHDAGAPELNVGVTWGPVSADKGKVVVDDVVFEVVP